MDGYTFMMFAVGASILGVVTFIGIPSCRRQTSISFVFHAASFAFTYYLFSIYLDKSEFDAAPLDFFRGWGADLFFFAVPTEGVHWIFDLIGWSQARSEETYFGDSSVWITTFCLPLIVGAVFALVRSNRSILKIAFLLIAIFGFYMSLGPSLKVNSVKPSPEISASMSEKFAVAPTGSAVFSTYLPGLKNMRASYRWTALGFLGAWALIVLAMSIAQPRFLRIGAALSFAVITILNLPDVPKKVAQDKSHRAEFMTIDDDILADMKNDITVRERVAFLPWGNDFLVNYLAAKLDIIAYNIGGDKNLVEARKSWPETLKNIPMTSVSSDFAGQVALLLIRKEADAVVVPYVDMLWAEHHWPHPWQYKDSLVSYVRKLKGMGYFDVTEREHYALVRVHSKWEERVRSGELDERVKRDFCIPPYCIEVVFFDSATPTQVGLIEEGKVKSAGQAGFVIFGPYAPLQKGTYTLELFGATGESAGGWVDVVSKKGTIVHGKFPLESNISAAPLVHEKILIDATASDIEVRVFVEEGDDISVSGYYLKPIGIADVKSG